MRRVVVIIMMGFFVVSVKANFDVSFEAFSAGERLESNLHNEGWYEESGRGADGILIHQGMAVSGYTMTTAREPSGSGWVDTDSGMPFDTMNSGVVTFDVYGFVSVSPQQQARSYIRLGAGTLAGNEVSMTTSILTLVRDPGAANKAWIEGPGYSLHVGSVPGGYVNDHFVIDIDNDRITWWRRYSSDGITWGAWTVEDPVTTTADISSVGLNMLMLEFSTRLDHHAYLDYSRFVMVPEPATLLLLVGAVVGLLRHR